MIDNRGQGLIRHDNATSEFSVRFAQASNFVCIYDPLLPIGPVDIAQFGRPQHFRPKTFHIPGLDRPEDWEGVDYAPFHKCAVSAGRSGAEVDNTGIPETPLDLLPARCGVVVGLIHEDHIKEVIREGIKPTILLSGDLLNVRDCYIGMEDIIDINPAAFYYCRLRILLRCAYDVAAVIKIGFAVCSKIVAELGSDPRTRGDYKRTLTLKCIG